MISIRNRYTDEVILEGNYETLAELINANRYKTNQYKVNLSNADLSNSDLSNVDLSNTNLFNVSLFNVDLSNTNLSHANLSNTNLSHANLSNSNLSNSNLSNVDLSNTKSNLVNANLSNADLSNAKWDDKIIEKIYQISNLGSRKSELQIWVFVDKTLMIRTGCFTGTEQEFIDAVEKTHGFDSKYGKEYKLIIDTYRQLILL